MEKLDIEKEIALEKKAIKQQKLGKNVLNIIRTQLRNNIELTAIADNKANVLLSLNALMLTFMVPFLLPYTDIISKYQLVYPLIIMVISSLTTIYMSALVLKPSKFSGKREVIQKGRYISPFFFGNFYNMDKEEFNDYIKIAVNDEGLVNRHVTEDLHFTGTRLGRKMNLIRKAFDVFMIGFSASIILALILMIVFH